MKLWLKWMDKNTQYRGHQKGERTENTYSLDKLLHSLHCAVSTTFSNFSYCILHKPCKIAKTSKETRRYAVLCKPYTTHYTCSILQCCRLQYYAGQDSGSSAAGLELLTNQGGLGNECCVVSDVMQVQSHADLIILLVINISFISAALTDTGARLATGISDYQPKMSHGWQKSLKRPGYEMYRRHLERLLTLNHADIVT